MRALICGDEVASFMNLKLFTFISTLCFLSCDRPDTSPFLPNLNPVVLNLTHADPIKPPRHISNPYRLATWHLSSISFACLRASQ
jgi:hypothetical protein